MVLIEGLGLMFSVIIPVGPGRTGRNALLSLAGAGLGPEDEVVVVGDGHAVDIPAECANLRVANVRLPSRRGANAARNHGASLAKGEILCFLDDDDEYVKDCFPVLKKAIQTKENTQAWVLNWKLKSGRRFFLTMYPRVITERSISRRNRAGGASSMVVRKAMFEQAGGFDETMVSMQDWELWLRLSRRTRIRRISAPLIIYNDVGADRISTNRTTRISGLNQILQKHGRHWSTFTRAFHKARIASLEHAAGQGKWRDIFHWQAPLASLFFAIRPNR